MKKLKIDAVIFLIIIAMLGLANLLHFNKPTVSHLENRALKQKPEFSLNQLLSGNYFKEFEEYYSDTFILRDDMVKASRDMREALSFLGSDVKIVTSYEDIQLPAGSETQEPASPAENPADSSDSGNTADTGTNHEGSSPQGTETPDPSPTPAPEPEKDFGDGPNVGYWMVVDGKAVQLFKFNKENFEYYAKVLNKYCEELGSGVKIYSMIPPTNSEFMQLKKYKGITDSQNDALDFLKSRLDRSITSVDVFAALNKHKDEYIYFRTDHHWTALGAYYAYASFMDAKGEKPVELDRYEAVDLGGFLGSSYTKTLDKSLEKNPDQLIAYKPFTNYQYLMYHNGKETSAEVIDLKYADDISQKYLAFISTGGASWSVIKTDIKNGRRVMVVKDSFGNALVPFLLPHYEEIYVVDSRFYNVNETGNIADFVKDKGINEVLFVIYMEDVNWHKFMAGVENLLGTENN